MSRDDPPQADLLKEISFMFGIILAVVLGCIAMAAIGALIQVFFWEPLGFVRP